MCAPATAHAASFRCQRTMPSGVLVLRADGPAGVIASAAQRGAEGDHGDREPEVQPVVGVVDWNEVGRTVVIYDQAIDEQQQIHDAATDEVRAGTVERAGQCNPGDTECQVHQVVQHRHVEDSEKCGIGVMAGEGELVVVRRDAGNEAEHADGRNTAPTARAAFCTGVPNLDVDSDVWAG